MLPVLTVATSFEPSPEQAMALQEVKGPLAIQVAPESLETKICEAPLAQAASLVPSAEEQIPLQRWPLVRLVQFVPPLLEV